MSVVFDESPFSFFLKQGDELQKVSLLLGRCNGKVGLYCATMPHEEFLACIFDDIYENLGNPFNGEYIGFKTRIGDLYGYYCGNKQILKEEYQDISPFPNALQFYVKKDSLFGELRYDINSDVLSELIPVSYSKMIYGKLSLVAGFSDGKWDLFRKLHSDTRWECDYGRIGTFDTIVDGFSEPYPLYNGKICLFESINHLNDKGIQVDSLLEVSRSCYPGLLWIWTIVKNNDRFGLWCNTNRWFVLPIQYDSIAPINTRDEYGDDKYPLFKVCRENRIGVYSVEEKRFLINVVFDWVLPIRHKNDDLGVIFGFIVRFNDRMGMMGVKGEFLIEPQYDSIKLLRVEYLSYNYSEWDREEKLLLLVKAKTGYGVFSDCGHQIVNTDYDQIELIKTKAHERCWYYVPEETILFKVKKGKLVGIIDEDGSVFLDCEYDEIAYVREMDIFVVKKGYDINNISFYQIDKDHLLQRSQPK